MIPIGTEITAAQAVMISVPTIACSAPPPLIAPRPVVVKNSQLMPGRAALDHFVEERDQRRHRDPEGGGDRHRDRPVLGPAVTLDGPRPGVDREDRDQRAEDQHQRDREPARAPPRPRRRRSSAPRKAPQGAQLGSVPPPPPSLGEDRALAAALAMAAVGRRRHSQSPSGR